MLSVNSDILALLFAMLLALNPFSVAALLAVISGGLGSGHSVRRVRVLIFTFLGVLFGLYAGLGLVGLYILGSLEQPALVAISLVASIVAIVWGIVELGNLFSGRLRVRMPSDLTASIHRHTTKQVSARDALKVGSYTAVATIFVAGPPLIALACLASLLEGGSSLIVCSCALVLIAPLIILASLVLRGARLSAISAWCQESTATLRGIIGLTGILLGWLVLLALGGVIEGTT